MPVPGPLGSLGASPPAKPDIPSQHSVVTIGDTSSPSEPAAPRRAPTEAGGFGDELALAAAYYLDHEPRGARNDCSGFVCAAWARTGHDLAGNTRSLWELARDEGVVHRRKRPSPGDLAFFDNTYDRNGNGRRDDELTHIAIVIEVFEDGTILMAHGGTSKGRTELRMNLAKRDVQTGEDGQVLNDILRRRGRDDPESIPTLAGELWRGFASLRPAT